MRNKYHQAQPTVFGMVLPAPIPWRQRRIRWVAPTPKEHPPMPHSRDGGV